MCKTLVVGPCTKIKIYMVEFNSDSQHVVLAILQQTPFMLQLPSCADESMRVRETRKKGSPTDT